LYRLSLAGWVYWEGTDGRQKAASERGQDEEIFEVCCEFLDERVPDGGVDGDGADHDVNCQTKEEKRRDEHCADREYKRFHTDAGCNGSGDFVYCFFCADDGRK
jgi:hypothetical protein